MTRRMDAEVHALLRRARDVYRAEPEHAELLDRHLARMTEPLRVAIAGKVKAGKSTLLNALVGERVAPTGTAECTRAVTWYRNAATPRITMVPRSGQAQQLPIARQDGALVIDMLGTPADDVDRLVVDWPSSSLSTSTLIDTPGIGSLSGEVSARTTEFLLDEDDPTEADAVIYLMRHVHTTDLAFLEAFNDNTLARSTPTNTVAVLARADEIGAGRLDAMTSARRIARRHAADERLRKLCHTVIPVAGLLAETARTLRQAEINALTALAHGPRAEVDSWLLSADRFVSMAQHRITLPPAVLLARLGLYGIRLGITLIRQGFAGPAELTAELVRRSGLDDLRKVLAAQFTSRGHLLKARSGLMVLDSLLRRHSRPAGVPVLADVERLLAGAHEFAELRLLDELRSGALELPGSEHAEVLLGGAGTDIAARLGLRPAADRRHAHAAALSALGEWQRRAENPLLNRRFVQAARVLVRTCEGLLAEIDQTPAGGKVYPIV
jgi:Dynamin family